jgi:hypothetical protein
MKLGQKSVYNFEKMGQKAIHNGAKFGGKAVPYVQKVLPLAGLALGPEVGIPLELGAMALKPVLKSLQKATR